jgi:hypothetical protein
MLHQFLSIIEVNRRVSELDNCTPPKLNISTFFLNEHINMASSTSPKHGYVKRNPKKYGLEWNLGP